MCTSRLVPKPRLRAGFCALLFTAASALPSHAATFSADRLRAHTVTLSDDSFEGRSPGTPGEAKTVAYLISEFEKLGLEPGHPDGGYVQEVPLIGLTSDVTAKISAGSETFEPMPVNEWSAISRRVTPLSEVKDSEIVFVGYGIVAPEYGWDDYKDVDVRGKTLVMLINDPPVPSAAAPENLDPAVFKGRAMTYYGRWTYKYEIAAEKGAAACLIIHETGPAGYPFAVVGSGAGREHFELRSPDGNLGRAAVEAWMTYDFSQRLFRAAGHDLAALKRAAARKDFQPVSLGARASFTVKNAIREVKSQNVVARLTGADKAAKNEFVVYTSHWDHLGRDERLEGDQIFNGAADNASGTAMLLEIAREFSRLPDDERPRRSLLFLAVTAEEKGLLGSRFYAENPLYPLEKTVANLNMDGANHFARTRDIEVIGSGATTIEDVAVDVAAEQGRIITADTQPEKGFYFRSDHFEFAKVGVPAFYAKAGRQPLDKPESYIDEKRGAYITHHYHKVSDEVREDWDFEAAAQDADFLFRLGRRLADTQEFPSWKPGSEFKARREAMLAK